MAVKILVRSSDNIAVNFVEIEPNANYNLPGHFLVDFIPGTHRGAHWNGVDFDPYTPPKPRRDQVKEEISGYQKTIRGGGRQLTAAEVQDMLSLLGEHLGY